MSKQASSNHGEGNPEAAEQFNSAEQKFVQSPTGKQKIREGAHVRPDEEKDLAKAEEAGRERSKGDDTASVHSQKR